MGISQDSCDFCDCYVDPMGGDTAQLTVDSKLWCGLCIEGAQHMYGHLSSEQLLKYIEEAEEYLEENPLWSHREDSSAEPEDHMTHLFKLRLQDRIYAMRQILAEREKAKP